MYELICTTSFFYSDGNQNGEENVQRELNP